MTNQELATEAKLTAVRDILIDRHGDHMVASTIFSKRFPAIYREIARGFDPAAVAKNCDYVDFAGYDGYEV